MKKRGESRICFPGSPWPAGHRIEALSWTGRLDPSRGLFFDLHLQSAPYCDEPPSVDEEDSDWKSVACWSNYHRCTLSSTGWAGYEGVHVADALDPLDWNTLGRWEFYVDSATPVDDEEFAFHIYLMGHDCVRRHRMRFAPKGSRFDLEWTAKIALAYGGHTDLKYELQVEAKNIAFGGFQIPNGMSLSQARKALAPFVRGSTQYAVRKGRFCPKG